ncbi:MAG: twin-arginine translocase subunit TatC [Calditrichota bacterium]
MRIRFLISLTPSYITPGFAIDYYIGFAIRLMFLFGMVFELPVLSFFLGKIGIINTRLMRTYRRHSIIFIFVVAAVLTPPDPFTQLLLGVPLILLYEISIGVVHLVEKRRLKALEKQIGLPDNQNDTEPAG